MKRKREKKTIYFRKKKKGKTKFQMCPPGIELEPVDSMPMHEPLSANETPLVTGLEINLPKVYAKQEH